MGMKLGFVDYYLSEWHANNYPNWIAQICEKKGIDAQVCYAWGELDVSPYDNVTSAEWCEKYGVTLCASIEEVCEKSDYIFILAPSNPEKHLEYARTVLSYGKRTYIDKTFAPNEQEASEIFALSKKYNAPMFSSSALRYSADWKDRGEVKSIMVTGGGSNLAEYIVHSVEVAVSLLRDPAARIRLRRHGGHHFVDVVTKGGKEAEIVYSIGLPYTASATGMDGEIWYAVSQSAHFLELISDILHFFESGELSFDPAQTMEVMHLRDAILKADAENDFDWINLD